jgi:hypothetical protein
VGQPRRVVVEVGVDGGQEVVLGGHGSYSFRAAPGGSGMSEPGTK